eukprot:CAMPEP_0174872520 /NCGR_PEP_ID=MMETSP1114-20130205/73387_1 /TAXON_ID=312471 /ORGANISM="Neobodo designis, Strain CCAP 1951/1" /LENGTH=40 /DNA_ID= /DNA_START= /DNA_END= /DNA_ORIENTATION=
MPRALVRQNAADRELMQVQDPTHRLSKAEVKMQLATAARG